jgi:hypothetical protein
MNLYAKFDDDVREVLGQKLRASDEAAAEFWSSLANVGWFHESAPSEEVGYTFRAAGGLIAQIRADGGYLDWYCSGPYAVIATWIAELMATKGWSACVMDQGGARPREEWKIEWPQLGPSHALENAL